MCTGATWRSQWKLSFVRRRRRRCRRSTCSFASIDILWSNAVFVFASNCRWLPPPLHTTSSFRFLMPLILPLSLFPTFSLFLSPSFLFFRRPSGMGSLAAGAKCQSAGNTRTHLPTHTHSHTHSQYQYQQRDMCMLLSSHPWLGM